MTRQFSEAYSAILAVDFTETSEMTSSAFYPITKSSQVCILVGSDQAGTVDIDIQLSDGSWYEVITDFATVADLVEPIVLDFTPRAVRARWTPDAAPGAICIDASYSQFAS